MSASPARSDSGKDYCKKVVGEDKSGNGHGVEKKGSSLSLLVDYADFRQQVQDVRETRKSGYSSDSRTLFPLASGMLEARVAAESFRNNVHVAGVTDNKTQVTASNLLYAYDAMSRIVQAEIDRNLFLEKSDVPLRLAEKHEEIWKMVDPSIHVVPFP